MKLGIALIGVLICLASIAFATEAPDHKTLTFEDRVAAQAAIEQVYWDHRIWPKENPEPKPALSAVLPDSAIRASVESYLKKSNALDALWHRPITAQQLQAEIDRMVQGSRDPGILRELFAALGNDPVLIAETLARQTLADRLIHSWYANDDRLHGDLKARAETTLASCKSVGCMKSMNASYVETTWRRSGDTSDDRAVLLDAGEWNDQLDRLAREFDTTVDALPTRKLSRIEETEDSFVVVAVLARDADTLTTASAVWPKASFDGWWQETSATLDTNVSAPAGSFSLTAPAVGGCVVDHWKPTYWWLEQRVGSSAVWTGTEMIVWGGVMADTSVLNTGGRYNPATDAWVATSTGANVPARRTNHTAVWTGTEMIVWGGNGRTPSFNSTYLNTGGRYNPTTDSWLTTPLGSNVPQQRNSHTAVWTGSQMIVWGGVVPTGKSTNTGGRYNPSTNTWAATSTAANVPSARVTSAAVWTGTEMIVWGGYTDIPNYLVINSGGRYNPTTDAWVATSQVGSVPVARTAATAVWTGSEMIIWGGAGLNSGGRYNPSTNSWATTSTGTGVPPARNQHTAVWTGTEMIVWGGSNGNPLDSGGRYTPSTDSWSATSAGANVPSARSQHAAVWTGSDMLVWGGGNGPSISYNNGGRYSPATDSWAPTTLTGNAPPQTYNHIAVWTGSEMIVWGGVLPAGGIITDTGGRYNAATDSWIPTPRGGNAPQTRYGHSGIWTGAEMIIWGGTNGVSEFNSGNRYSPSTNAWSLTSTGVNVPTGRKWQATVWTGTEMIVWGGSSLNVNTGGRYKPSTDSWMPTSTGINVPVGRSFASAVWTGTEMIVWGGAQTEFGTPYNSGGRYNPSTDSWLATSTGANAPTASAYHTAVWTGSEMIIWGGQSTGGRYNPASDSWSTVSAANVSVNRQNHSAIWTGNEMVVWGGYQGDVGLRTGGRYNPTSNSWIATGLDNPTGRKSHTAVWTGTEMIVWGGTGYNDKKLGERYCVAGLVYRDADGDGYGDPALSTAGSLTSIPAGYVTNADDCNDQTSAIRPGATETCNGIDDNCNLQVDEGLGLTLYQDADGDGYGVTAITQFGACAASPGWATQSGDCNDANPAVHPGAPELCNGQDDDCDNLVDEDALGVDTDGDGVRNACDNCRSAANADQLDNDHDGVGNACDNCFFVANASQVDADNDALGDACDNCPLSVNPSQSDIDSDRAGDVCDNCALDYNPAQSDFNHNGSGDVCDLSDGLIYVLGTDDKDFVEWQQENGPTAWNVYTGDLSILRATGSYTQAPGSNPSADRHCGVADLYVADPAVPVAFAVKFSLVTGVTGGVEGSLGANSAGVPRANTNPCP